MQNPFSRACCVFTVYFKQGLNLAQTFTGEKTCETVKNPNFAAIIETSMCPATSVFWGHEYATGSPLGLMLKDLSVSFPLAVARQQQLSGWITQS